MLRKVVIKGALRVELLECVVQHVQVLVGSVGAEFFVDKGKVLVAKGLALDGVVDFEDAEDPHDVCALGLVGLLGHHGRDDCLEVGADGHERVAVVLQRHLGGRAGGIDVFGNQNELLILHVLVPGQRGADELSEIGVLGGPAVEPKGMRGVLKLTLLVLHLTVLLYPHFHAGTTI